MTPHPDSSTPQEEIIDRLKNDIDENARLMNHGKMFIPSTPSWREIKDKEITK